MSGATQISNARSYGGQLLEEGTAFAALEALGHRPEDGVRSSAPSEERHEVVVIGGGQAGLSVGYHLQREGVPFVILDARARIGDAWRERWDSLRLFTPRRFDGLDGMSFPGVANDFRRRTKWPTTWSHTPRASAYRCGPACAWIACAAKVAVTCSR